MKTAIQYFQNLADRKGKIIQAPKKLGVYIKNAPHHASNTLANIPELRNNLRVLISGCLTYKIQLPTFHRWQFPLFAVIWHKEKDGAEWIEILKA